MTSLPPCALRSKDVRPSLVTFPTLWDCSLLVSDIEPRADELLVEDEPIRLATLSLELLVDEDDSLTDEERDEDDERLTDDEDLSEDELLTEAEPSLRRLLS